MYKIKALSNNRPGHWKKFN